MTHPPIFSSPLQVFTAFFVFLSAFFLLIPLAKQLRCSIGRLIVLYAYHSSWCLIYLWYAINYGADSSGYYRGAVHGVFQFGLGADGVIGLAHVLYQVLDLSYLGMFLFFNVFGSIGLLYFDASLRHATLGSIKNIRWLASLIIFLPSVSFWSAAVGKDAISFMAINMAMWASLRLRSRTFLMLMAVSFMLLVRPHMAGMLVMALGVAMAFDRSTPISRRILVGALSLSVGVFLIPYALHYAGLQGDADISSVANLIDKRQSVNMGGGSSVDIADMSLPQQMFTYAYRPIFVDARSSFDLAASLDNFILLYISVYGFYRVIKRRQCLDENENRTFLWGYVLLSWTLLAMTTANLGIALRQKWMFVPVLIFLLISLLPKMKDYRRF